MTSAAVFRVFRRLIALAKMDMKHREEKTDRIIELLEDIRSGVESLSNGARFDK